MNYRLIDWGKSMYGGYYANVIEDGEFMVRGMVYLYAHKYTELCKQLAAYGLKAERTKRFDN